MRALRLTVFLPIATALVVSGLAGTLDAGEVVIRGSLTLSGTRWENGVASRVSCNSSFGGFMNAGPTLRLLAVAPTEKCGIAADGEGLPPSPFGAFRFLGVTRQITERGRVKSKQIYAAVPTSPGVEGLMIGVVKLNREGRATSEKGTLIYRQVIEDRVIQFRGAYRSNLKR